MSYLLAAGTAPRTVQKWGLGRFNTRKFVTPQRRNLRGLGQDSPDCPASVIDPFTGELCANLPPIAPPPSQPGVDPAVQQAYKNLLTTQQASQNPLDYVSPQAAIAAGLPAQAVYNAWSAGLAKFPTQQAALQAGIPAGVVTQLWAQSRSAAPASSSGFFSGISTTTLLLIGGGILVLPRLLGRRR